MDNNIKYLNYFVSYLFFTDNNNNNNNRNKLS